MRGVYITWADINLRSHIVAKLFQLEEVNFGQLRTLKRSFVLAVFRYAYLSLYTLVYLWRRNPQVVFSPNLPIFEPMVVVFWGILFRRKVVIDNHSGLFTHKAWRWSLPIVKHFFGRATFCIVTNRHHKALIESWGGRAEIMGALVLPNEVGVANACAVDEHKVTVIASFFRDEPIEAILAAASQLPDFDFYITGSLKNAKKSYLQVAPANVTFTDFLSRKDFVTLVKTSMCALVLVTDDNTMQRGAYEAMSFETPVITSRWPVLLEAFPKGVLFVDNLPSEIAEAVRQMSREYDQRKQEIVQLKQETHQRLQAQVARVQDRFLR